MKRISVIVKDKNIIYHIKSEKERGISISHLVNQALKEYFEKWRF